jgi:hypothetical protein
VPRQNLIPVVVGGTVVVPLRPRNCRSGGTSSGARSDSPEALTIAMLIVTAQMILPAGCGVDP